MRLRAVLFVIAAVMLASLHAQAQNSNPWHLVGAGDTPGVHLEIDGRGVGGLPVSTGLGTATVSLKSTHEQRTFFLRCIDVAGDGEPDTYVSGSGFDSSGVDWSFRIYLYKQDEAAVFGMWLGRTECTAGYPFEPNGVGTFTVNAPLVMM